MSLEIQTLEPVKVWEKSSLTEVPEGLRQANAALTGLNGKK